MSSNSSPEKIIWEEPTANVINTSTHKNSSFHSNNGRPQKRVRNKTLSTHQTTCPIPVLRPETTDTETYDLDMLLDIKLQRQFISTRHSAAITESLRASGILKNLSNKNSDVFEPEAIQKAQNTVSSFTNRMDADILKREVQKLQLEQQLEENELKSCTFSPRTLSPRIRSRSPAQFYQEQKSLQINKEQNLRKMHEDRQKQVTGQQTHTPSLCRRSMSMVKMTERDKSIGNRLHGLHKTSLSRASAIIKSEGLFTDWMKLSSKPTSPLNSTQITTQVPIGNLVSNNLYADAQKRQKNSKSLSEQNSRSSSPNVRLNPKSANILTRSLRIDFKNAWNELGFDENEMSYENFLWILEKLNFINNDPKSSDHDEEMHLCDKLWDKTQKAEPSEVTSKSLCTLLVKISNLDPDKNWGMSEFSSLVARRNAKSRRGTKTNTKQFTSTISSEETSSSQKSQTSQKNHVDRLFQEAVVFAKNKETIRNYVDFYDKKKCTFKPKILKKPPIPQRESSNSLGAQYAVNTEGNRIEALHEYAAVRAAKIVDGVEFGQKQASEADEDACSFKPDLSKTSQGPVGLNNIVKIKGAKEAASRVRHCFKERVAASQQNLRGAIYQSNLQPSMNMDIEPSSIAKIKSIAFTSSKLQFLKSKEKSTSSHGTQEQKDIDNSGEDSENTDPRSNQLDKGLNTQSEKALTKGRVAQY